MNESKERELFSKLVRLEEDLKEETDEQERENLEYEIENLKAELNID